MADGRPPILKSAPRSLSLAIHLFHKFYSRPRKFLGREAEVSSLVCAHGRAHRDRSRRTKPDVSAPQNRNRAPKSIQKRAQKSRGPWKFQGPPCRGWGHRSDGRQPKLVGDQGRNFRFASKKLPRTRIKFVKEVDRERERERSGSAFGDRRAAVSHHQQRLHRPPSP